MSTAKETLHDELFTRLAEQIGLTEDQLDDELDGPMSDTTARRLSAVFGPSAQFWSNLARRTNDPRSVHPEDK